MKRIFTFMCLWAACHAWSIAQTTVTVGTGTSTTPNAPITAYYGYSYNQMIYTAPDIMAAGGNVGMISKVRFYYNNGSNNNSNNWTVYLGHTTKNSFANGSDWEAFANLTQVYTGTVTFPAAGNWFEITLSTPFYWNGIDNLLIAVDENQPGFSDDNMYWRNTATGANNRSIYYRSDSFNPNPASPPAATGLITSMPNVQLDITIAECAGTPVHDTVATSAANICGGNSVTLSTNNNFGVAGMQYAWQINDGSGWMPLAGTGPSITAALTQTSAIRVVATCTNSGLSDTASSVNVVVNTAPVISIDSSSYGVCTGGSVVITASGASTYSWTPTTGLDDPSVASVIATPASYTLYTVTGTDAVGCTGTSSVPVFMMSNIVGTVTTDPAMICSEGAPVDVIIGGLPEGLSGMGTYEYQFLAEDTTTVVQAWGASDTYTFTPGVAQEYAFLYQVRNTACPAEVNGLSMINFSVGFGADVAIQDYNCNHPEGIFTLYNIFGQAEIGQIFYNPLNSAASLTDISFSGAASIAGGRAQITPSATGQNGAMLIDMPAVVLGLNNSMEVSFLMTHDTPINTYGTGGADGMTYSFGNDATAVAPGPNQNGKGSKLRLCFDSANNGSENGNATGIYLVYGWTGTNAYGPASGAVLAYSPNTSLWKIQTDIPVKLTINTLGQATVTVAGSTIFSNVQLPASYMTEDVTNWNHLFTAATGGDAMRQCVSDFRITTNELAYGIVSGSSATPPASWQPEPVFDGLTPGLYTLWMSNPDDPTCRKNLGVYEIADLNPVVFLGNDTTICSGENIVLNAENPGATYLWTGAETTQTITVSAAGSYAVSVTDTVGCMGIGAINVAIAPVPAADGIFAGGVFPDMFLSVDNPSDATQYNWNFGDTHTANNAGSAVMHTYDNPGSYVVTVVLFNEFDCDSTVISETVQVINTSSIEDNNAFALSVYPNPANDFVNIIMDDYNQAAITVYNVTGSVLYAAPLNTAKLDVVSWESGIYFIKVDKDGRSAIVKMLVKH